MNRRSFLRNTALATAGLSLAEAAALAASRRPLAANKLPKWKGFNILDFYSPDPAPARQPTTDEHFKWIRDWGFDFVRIPMAYPHYLQFDRSRNITPEDVYHTDPKKLDEIGSLVAMAHKYDIHVCLNLHRAPGYCVNSGFYEPYNLWTDKAAQDAFYFHWDLWAKRFKNVSSKKISFDLLNEPSMREDMNDQHSKRSAVPGEVYRKVAKAAADTIHRENPGHLVIADGNNVGNNTIPEIADLNIAQSCRGYYPHVISHYKAPWVYTDEQIAHLPDPKWPGQVGTEYLSREMLEKYYKPWIDLVGQGVGVHCGECGSWNKTPHEVFLAWFGDVTNILSNAGIGFALWNFIGDFGILDSRRTDVAYEDWHGHKLDRKLLDLVRKA
ncbi:MAG: cellulase family glycosylhydrolase [Puia sp.]|nr:cellulase family glycosylhydrolase [Puia sp.]